MRTIVPVIDLFSGPGGLGEGFSRFKPDGRKHRCFQVAVSVEMDAFAHRTLLLRAFYRQFPAGPPKEYFQYLKGTIKTQEELFQLHPKQAKAAREEALHRELGVNNEAIYEAIEKNLTKHRGHENSVLIGGPPCQAYSVIGRSRKAMATDDRVVLYQEYLKIIAQFQPAVFVMENVKGLISSEVKLDASAKPHINGTQERIFFRILKDLKQPVAAVRERDAGWKLPEGKGEPGYRIWSLVTACEDPEDLKPTDFIIRAEEYGVPQTRHRVILLGVRSDLDVKPRPLTKKAAQVTVEQVLKGLPALRSQLSKRKDQDRDSPESWAKAVRQILDAPWLETLNAPKPPMQTALFVDDKVPIDKTAELRGRIQEAVQGIDPNRPTGMESRYRKHPRTFTNTALQDWFYNSNLRGVCNHESRMHMVSDLHRYLYLACYAEVYGSSPTIRYFPEELLPDHKNLKDRKENEEDVFDDRFRVQVWDRPATTITAHISKDGHYNIHPDPTQCRALTVREAARIQTFPDDYFFEGPRTEGYKQVGNAVPPLLAYQIAEVVYELLDRWSRSSTASASSSR
jgi:DNA (cytosine-5)-methyltransferase 1